MNTYRSGTSGALPKIMAQQTLTKQKQTQNLLK